MWLRLSYWAFRLSVVLSVASMAALVLYLTPLPDLYFASCDRPCHELDWPMICRFKLVLESHQSMGPWCGDCPRNLSDCHKPGCILADGTPRRAFTANKQLPGPSIQVCENDILVVDVVNRLPGQGVAVHWRGQPQRESPYMDGVPMVTQCPISSYTTFQYKFRASQAGTHIWHAHTGNELLDGLFGSLIVRKADRVEELRQWYDKDEKQHVLVLSEWGSSILVNGVSSEMDELIPLLAVNKGLRYRIRVAHGGENDCPLFLNIEDHLMTVIALDGKHIEPIKTATFKITQGERIDFVLDASNKPKSYIIKVESNCTKSKGFAKIVYNDTATENQPSLTIPQLQSVKTTKLLSTITGRECNENSQIDIVCLGNIKSFRKMPPGLSSKRADITLYLPFDYTQLVAAATGIREMKPRLNNITFLFPPSPLLSQGEGSEGLLCNENNLHDCSTSSSFCECTHVIEIPLHSSVEIVLINQAEEGCQSASRNLSKLNSIYKILRHYLADTQPLPHLSSKNEDHVFHLHGQSFFVTAVTANVPFVSLANLKTLDAKDLLLKRNLRDPVGKDTISVPRSGAAAIRFKANNPGYWLLHEQSSSEWARGLDVVLKVGSHDDFPPTPDNFPKCGSWVGPEFFLI